MPRICYRDPGTGNWIPLGGVADLAAAGVVEKVWDTGTNAYIWPGPGGTAPAASYTNIIFIDPTGTHDPTTSTGGRTVVNDIWEAGGQAPGNTGIVQEKSTALQGAWGSTASTAYVRFGNIPQPLAITKQFAATNFQFSFGLSGWVSAAGMVYIGASRDDTVGSVVQVGQFFFNESGSHRAFTGLYNHAGLAAGNYNCSLWTRTGAVITWQSDANDAIWWKVSEVWP